MRTWARIAPAVVAAVGSLLAACTEPSETELSRAGQVYIAAIRATIADLPPLEDPDDLPVVYVVGAGEHSIGADVQAEVATALRDDAAVRFADERAEAIDDAEPSAPVRSDGVLLAVGDVAEQGGRLDVDVEVYRSAADWSNRVVTFERRSSQWTVTSSSVVDAEVSPSPPAPGAATATSAP